MTVKEKSEKAGLKLNFQQTKIMASGPITLLHRLSCDCYLDMRVFLKGLLVQPGALHTPEPEKGPGVCSCNCIIV